MDDIRKAAYRGILYNFLLTIRSIPTPLTDDRQAMKLGRFVGPAAYQLHNLALASVNDFVGFDEAQFWKSMETFNINNPETQITHLQIQFERDLLAS